MLASTQWPLPPVLRRGPMHVYICACLKCIAMSTGLHLQMCAALGSRRDVDFIENWRKSIDAEDRKVHIPKKFVRSQQGSQVMFPMQKCCFPLRAICVIPYES